MTPSTAAPPALSTSSIELVPVAAARRSLPKIPWPNGLEKPRIVGRVTTSRQIALQTRPELRAWRAGMGRPSAYERTVNLRNQRLEASRRAYGRW